MKKNENSQKLTFEQTLHYNTDLVTVEEDERQMIENEKNKKKEIVSYTANRDTLFIPYPEKIKRPIDISNKIIEEKIEKPVADIGIQSDEILYENKEKVILILLIKLAFYSSKNWKRCWYSS